MQYREINVAADAKARDEMVAGTGMMAVPTVTDGKEFVVGFDKEKLEKIIH